MLVFDLDGVVTDLEAHSPNHGVLKIIAKDLKEGLPVAFITGRALIWVQDKILPELEKACDDDAKMSSLLIVTEKGAITTTRENGELKTRLDKRLALPQAFRNDAKELLDKDRGGHALNELMFWDETKRIIVSIEKRTDVPWDKFNDARSVLAEELRALLSKHGLSEFRVDATTIATDVEHVSAGKHKGAQDVLDWLRKQDSEPLSFVVFGDSASDSAIAETFGDQGVDTTFVFVGDPAGFKPDADKPYKTIITGGGYDADTAKYLRS